MSGSEAELALVLKAKNLASKEVNSLHGALTRVHGAAGRLGGGLVTLAKVGIAGLAVGATALVGFLGLATHAAAEEQVGVAKLDAALRANAKGFKGNTDAIEAVIKKREDLAFSDDELRASLTTLVTKYKDSDKALRLQATAMDLARLKGISLEEASVMLGKGLDGNAKVLKQLGIELPKTASEQERLTAIQKAAAGQAEKYGATAEGSQKAFHIALQDVVEDIGAGLLPIMTQAFTWLRTNAIPAIRDIIGRIQGWLAANKPLVDQVRTFVGGVLSTLVTVIGKVIGGIAGVIGAISNSKPAMSFLRAAVGFVAGAFDVMTKAVGFVIDRIADLIGWAQKAIEWLGKLNLITSRTSQESANYHLTGQVPGHAAGGWVGTHGPELGVLGERGPEYVIPNHQLGATAAMPGYQMVAVSERDLARMVDERLYFTLRRAAPTSGRV